MHVPAPMLPALLQDAWKAELDKRKVLHQKVLELKGAIRVFCRVRPLTPTDATTDMAIDVKDQENLVVNVPPNTLGEERRRATSAPLHGRRTPPSTPERVTTRECMCASSRHLHEA